MGGIECWHRNVRRAAVVWCDNWFWWPAMWLAEGGAVGYMGRVDRCEEPFWIRPEKFSGGGAVAGNMGEGERDVAGYGFRAFDSNPNSRVFVVEDLVVCSSSYRSFDLDVLLIVGLFELSMEQGFLSQKGSGVGRGVKEKQDLGSYPTFYKVHGHSPTKVTPRNKEDNLHGEKDGLKNNGGNGVNVVVLVESIRAISDRFTNTAYGFFLGKHEAYPKEDVGNVPVWVKLRGVLVTAFSEDSLSSIATKIGTPLMLDSYASDMCIQSLGRSSYARALIEVRADVNLIDNIVVAMHKLVGEGFYTCNVYIEYEWKPPKCTYCKVSKKNNVSTSGNKKKDVEPTNEVSKSNSFHVLNSVKNDVDLGTNGETSNLTNKKANSSKSSFWNAESSSTSTTPIVEKIDKMERLIIDETATLADDEGIPLTRVDHSSDHDSDDEVASVHNDMANFLAPKDVSYGTNSLLEQWKESYRNGEYDYDPYDNDMYEG
ncbi:retrotransposon protein, putative, ty1-copia subclass [Tanacetum coccineum]